VHVVLVEDQRKMADFIRKALQAEGFSVDWFQGGEDLLLALKAQRYDVIVLDIMLPGRDGLQTLQDLRKSGVGTPVILLTARGEVEDRVRGLNAGADDYLPKPFVLAELVARVRALGRRSVEARPVELRIADLSVDTVSREVKRGGRTIELTQREYRLLEYLMRSSGRVCSRMAIVEAVWDYDFDPGSNLVDVYIKRLRDKIDQEGSVRLFNTVRGVGYSLRVPQ
jgi:DNA-binding response OmpR family regulator